MTQAQYDLLLDKARMKIAMQRLFEGQYSEASDDTKLLWTYMSGTLYCHLYGRLRTTVMSGRLEGKQAFMQLVGPSEEGIAMVIVEKKMQEIIQTAAEKIDMDNRRLTIKLNIQQKMKDNQLLNDEERRHASGGAVGRQRGRKRKERAWGNVTQATVSSPSGSENSASNGSQKKESWELKMHQKTYFTYRMRVQKARNNNDAGGWYDEAFKNVLFANGIHPDQRKEAERNNVANVLDDIQDDEGEDENIYSLTFAGIGTVPV